MKVETLAVGAGLMTEAPEDAQLDTADRDVKRKERLRGVKKLIVKALEALAETGFLVDFEVTRSGLVNVRRASDEHQIF